MAVVSSRNLSFGGGLSIGNPVFTPAALFSAGEQGVWYDPSDFSTLYQDTSGSTPVTAVEQPVGMMLDKSQGLVLGSELVTNGTFDTDTAWTKFSATISGGSVDLQPNGTVTQSNVVSATQGSWYLFTVVISTNNGTAVVYCGTPSSGDARFAKSIIGATGTFSFYLQSGGVNSQVKIAATAAGSVVVDSISVKELPGNHAVAANNGTARPILRARYNLLTYSEQFDNAAWTKASCTITANSVAAPDSTTTADTLVSAAATAATYVSHATGTTSAASYTFSTYVKANGAQYVQLFYTSTLTSNYVNFDLNTGTVAGGSYTTASISDAGGGWYRLVSTEAHASSGNACFIAVVGAAASTRGATFTGDGTSGIYIWGAQLVANSVFPQNTYQRIAAATDYATGADFPPYLAFTTDDAMSTASIDFSATDEMSVFAGVTKNSDTVRGMVVELSGNFTNPGSFQLNAPSSNGTATYGFGSGGSVGVPAAAIYTNSSVSAPVSSVVTGTADISQDVMNLRVGGALVATDSTDQGSGNYGNHPLYIGARSGTSLFFNGSLYSLIVRGKTTLPSEITATEAWVADKTGVTL